MERETGLTKKSIRFYEAKGLINVLRSDNAYRDYDKNIVRELQTICLFRKTGIAISDLQLWHDKVIYTEEILKKRCYELKGESRMASGQLELCEKLLSKLNKDCFPTDSFIEAEGKFQDDVDTQVEGFSNKTLCLGIDIGTTTISAIIFNLTDQKSAGSYTIQNNSSLFCRQHEWEKAQDVHKITERVMKLLDSLMQRFPNIKAIGITGQMHGIVYLDKDGNAVSPLYTWQDERGNLMTPKGCTYCKEIQAETGYNVPTGYGFATHFYQVKNQLVPPNAYTLCTIMDYIGMKLTGRQAPIIHNSNAASLGFFLVQKGVFDTTAINQLGLGDIYCPEVTAENEIIGEYHGIDVSIAIGDNQASFLGSVKDWHHSVLANFGTGSQISVMSENYFSSSEIEARPFLGNSYLISGLALCGGRAYALLEKFFRQYAIACGLPDKEQYEVLNALAQKGILLKNPLKVNTTFCGTRQDSTRCGSISNMNEGNFTQEALAAGVLEGMASELYSMFRKMPREEKNKLIVSGNAARKNPVLVKILSQIFQMPVHIPKQLEEAAFGAAMFAAVSSQLVNSIEEISECIFYEGEV